MNEIGKRNPACGIDAAGLTTTGKVHYNSTEAELYEEAIRRGEARLTAHGALVAETGQHTGRSAKDKFVVRDAATDPHIWWDNNKALSPEHFDRLLADFQAHAKARDLFVQDLVGGADDANSLAGPRRHRVCVAFPFYSQSPDPACRRRSRGFRAADDHHQSALVPGRP